MKRLIEAMDTVAFWRFVFVVAVTLVFVYSFVGNRDAITRNAEVLQRQQQQLIQLCETIRVLDIATTQQGLLAVEVMGRKDVPQWAREYLSRRNVILDITHAELSESSTCRQIE